MSKDHKLDDAELANVSGAGELDNADIGKPPRPPVIPPVGIERDNATQQDDVGGGLTAPDLG